MEKMMKKVLTFMVGDIFHIGHLTLLQKAKALGDYLIVGLPSSWTINDQIKGRDPIFSSEERLRIVQAIRYVDFAFVYTDNEALNKSIKLLKPDIICRGDDNKNFIGRKVAEEMGIKIVFFPYTKGVSSGNLRKKL